MTLFEAALRPWAARPTRPIMPTMTMIDDRVTTGAAPSVPDSPAPSPDAIATLEEHIRQDVQLQAQEQAHQQAARLDGWMVSTFVLAAIALVASIVAVGFGSRAIDDAKRYARAATTPAAAPAATVTPGAASSASSIPRTVTLSEFRIDAGSAPIAPGKVTLNIANAGKVQHELLVFRTDTPPASFPVGPDGNVNEDALNKISDGDNLAPGSTQPRTVDLTQPGTYVFVCNLPGHFKAGMYTTLTVR